MPEAILINGDTLKLLDVQTDANGRLLPITSGHALRSPEGKLIGGAGIKVDAIITDPPYGISLDGDRTWDTFDDNRSFSNHVDDGRQFQKFIYGWSARLLSEVLAPGGHFLCFSSDRTVYRAGVGIEEAGFEVIGGIAWLYAQGQVKSKDRLGPSYEPIVVARKLTQRTLSAEMKATGRGFMQTRALAEEDGKHPKNCCADEAIFDPALYGDDEVDKAILSAPQFYYVCKPSPKERDWGCEDLPLREKEGGLSKIGGKTSMARNFHPTVKPITLMRRLIRLACKPGGWVIDPFMGSGTTGIACMLEGRNFIGIEREAEFFEICRHRIEKARNAPETAPK